MNRTHVTPATEVVATQLPGLEMVLLHVQRGEYYTLNESGGLIWQALQQPADLATISQRLALHYDLSLAEASTHVAELVEALAAVGLVHGV